MCHSGGAVVNGEGYTWVGARKITVPSTHFWDEPTTALKNKV